MSHYAEITDGTVTNVAVCDDPTFAQQMGWVGPIDTIDPQPGVGWSYDGTTWTAPAPPPPDYAGAIKTALTTYISEIETWISNNPNGATLTASQTLLVARMLDGVCRLLLNMTQSIGQVT